MIAWDRHLLALRGRELSDADRELLMVYPIGGIVCGLWRKSLITGSGVLFPEHLRFEDNYWSALILCYVGSVSFVTDIGYYYRKNPSSTVRGRNKGHILDRVAVERMLVEEARRRGLLGRYSAAFEYLYASRYVFGSFLMLAGKFDRPPKEEMVGLLADLKADYPKWGSNRHYREAVPGRRKAVHRLIWAFPNVMCMAINIFGRVRDRWMG